ncbi:wd-repeat protein [Cordyceps javanica]|uniref:Wd-repeat protein n=1 Tax=Cordyceps javanica TaxID=43265 RepID=A0A545UNT4_9HYPO|nr:wd-repeat protein [Cordyceps javanica]TQW02856.1 wd-repeat protein [Cordyceps javanica]
MKWLARLVDRSPRHGRPSRQPSPANEAPRPAPVSVPAQQPVEETPPQPVRRVSKTHNAEQSGSVWSAAYDEALSLLDEKTRLVVSERRNLETLFENLNETNAKQKTESAFRRGVGKAQIPMKIAASAMNMTSPLLGSFDPKAAAAFSIVQNVATLAVGVCGIEDRLNVHIADMLRQIKVIDECDTLGQKFDDAELIHEALVYVYKDLFLFYYAVFHVLTKKYVSLAWISEQFNERIPPVVQDFLKHASLLHQHINNATTKVIKSIEASLLDTKILKTLGKTHVDQLETFHLGLKTKMAHDACKWITEEPAFHTWHGTTVTEPLVLYGEMGAGKTATMAFIIDHAIQLNRALIPSALICYHYCHSDETGTSLYVFSSFIQQLMQRKPQFKVRFDSWFEKLKHDSYYSPNRDSKLLGDFFFDSIKTLERPVLIFLDGLDECDQTSCEELVTRFKHESLKIPGLRCCLSVRYNEQIQTLLGGFSEIHMQRDPKRDAVLVSHLVTTQLPFLEGEERNLVIERLSTLAKGSAIWVQLAVDLLASKKLRAKGTLKAFLRDELPQSKLPDLYSKLFSRVTAEDEDNAKLLSDALEVLATVERPLSISELGWAVALRGSEADIRTVQGLEDYVDTKRVLGFLSPFISSFQIKMENKRQLRLVHESVKELVFQAAPNQWANLPLSTQRSNATIHERRSELHGRLASECVRYLLFDEMGAQTLISSEQSYVEALDGLPGSDVYSDDLGTVSVPDDRDISAPGPDSGEPFFDPAERGFGGFFTYASSHWLHHLSRAERENGPGLSDVIALATPSLTRSENWWEQFYRPDCTRHHDETKFRPTYLEPLTIVSLYGPTYLFDDLLGQLSKSADGGLSDKAKQLENAVEAILQQGDLSRLTMLIDFAKMDEARQLCFNVMLYWSKNRKGVMPNQRRNFDLVFDHIAKAFDLMTEQKRGNDMLCLAASYGCLPIIERLFNAATRNPALRQEILRAPHRDDGKSLVILRHQSVGDAAWNGKGDTVAFLLAQQGIEAHLRYRDLKGNNVLHRAVRGSDLETLKLLLSRYPEGIAERSGDVLPLQSLIFQRRSDGAELVKAFLEAGADARCGIGKEMPSDWHEPIRMAARGGDLEVIKVLVRVGGVDPMSVFKQSDDGELQLIDRFDLALEKDVRETLLSLQEERRGGGTSG